jgi:hypothetical protein
VFIAALFTIAKLWKPPRCPTTDEWMKKMWYLHTVEFYSAMKKNETGDHYERGQPGSEDQISYVLPHMQT